MRAIAAVMVILLVIGSASHAGADAARDHRVHARAAREHAARGEHDAAIAEYLAAYAHKPDPAHLRAVGDLYLAKGDREQALIYYRRHIAEARPGAKRDEVAARIAELEQARADEEAAAARRREEEAAEARRIAAEEQAAADQRVRDRRDQQERIARLEADELRQSETARQAKRAEIAHAARRARVKQKRKTGWVLVGSSIGFTVFAGACVWLSAEVNDDIKAGFDYPQDYTGRAVDGQIWNNLGWSFGAAALLTGTVGLLILRANPLPRDLRVDMAPTNGGAGVSVAMPW